MEAIYPQSVLEGICKELFLDKYCDSNFKGFISATTVIFEAYIIAVIRMRFRTATLAEGSATAAATAAATGAATTAEGSDTATAAATGAATTAIGSGTATAAEGSGTATAAEGSGTPVDAVSSAEEYPDPSAVDVVTAATRRDRDVTISQVIDDAEIIYKVLRSERASAYSEGELFKEFLYLHDLVLLPIVVYLIRNYWRQPH
jgi:hypothetical protein